MAGRRTHVPKFGNWDANDHMPYTVVFDHARQGRGKPINPNDPQQNPDMFPAQGRSSGGGGLITGRRHFNPNDPEDDGADRNPPPQEKPQPERQQQEKQQSERQQQERQQLERQQQERQQSERQQQERQQSERQQQERQQLERQQQERQQQERQQPERPTIAQQGSGGIIREGSGSGSGSGPRAGQQPHQVAAGAAERRRVSGLQQGGNVPSRSQLTENKRPTGNVLDRNVDSTSSSFASANESPAHPSGLQGGRPATTTRLGGSSPAYDPTRRKSTGQNEEGQMFAPATPNRSRLSQRNGNNSAPKEEPSQKGPSSALPKFGAWDAQDPGSGDGFTVIFNNARNEKKSGGPVNIPRTPDKTDGDLYGDSNHGGVHKGHGGPKSWFCCYGSSNWKA